MWMNLILILFGKLVSSLSSSLNLGSGSTWPGHIVLSLNKNFIKDLLKGSKTKIILVAGTNGKTTTSKMLSTMISQAGFSVFQNEGGANLLNGIASALIQSATTTGKINSNFAIFEVDENTLPHIASQIKPEMLILLNLFRDQLDRYGEVNIVAGKWREIFQKLDRDTIVILNADDPQIAYLGKNLKQKVYYFGISDEDSEGTGTYNPMDSNLCPNCKSPLRFEKTFFSHLGIWKCSNCKVKRPAIEEIQAPYYPLPGVYNKYNTNAASLAAKLLGIPKEKIKVALKNFKPAFGRQETLEINGKNVQIFLSKNPTSFNQSLRTVSELGGKNILFVLNDRIPDGRDVSWIWDTDLEELNKFRTITVSGDRTYDIALRLKYEGSSSEIKNLKLKIKNYNVEFKIEKNLGDAVREAINGTPASQTLYILPTYSAMLEVRKILTGKKIL